MSFSCKTVLTTLQRLYVFNLHLALATPVTIPTDVILQRVPFPEQQIRKFRVSILGIISAWPIGD